MNEKITAQPPKEERQEVLKEIRQLENRKKILENKQRNEERRVRTRRLIERGAILEGIFPLASSLSGAEVKAFLIALSYLCLLYTSAPSIIGRYSSGQSFSLWLTRCRCSLSSRIISGLKYRSTGSPQILINWIITGRLGIAP